MTVMRMRCYKNGTDSISNTAKGQVLTSQIAHPFDILFLHRMLLSSACPTPVRPGERDKRCCESC